MRTKHWGPKIPDCLWVTTDPDSGGAIIWENGRRILTPSEFAALHARAAHFYATTTDAEINQYNLELDQEPVDPAPRPSAPARDLSGWVYAVGIDGQVKLGRSAKPEVRLALLLSGLPFEGQVFGLWQVSNAPLAEKQVHAAFAALRIRGEWFNLTPSQLDRIPELLGDLLK